MNNQLLFLVKLSENEKRMIIACLLLIIIAFVIIGLAVAIIKKILARYSRGIDSYVGDMLTYRVLTKPAEIRRYVAFREGRILVKKLLIPTGIFIGFAIFYSIFAIKDRITIEQFLSIVGELGIKFDWPMGDFFKMHIPVDFPSIGRWPKPDFNHTYVYMFSIALLVYGFMLMRRTLIYIARRYRAMVMSKKVFSKDLDHMRFESQ